MFKCDREGGPLKETEKEESEENCECRCEWNVLGRSNY